MDFQASHRSRFSSTKESSRNHGYARLTRSIFYFLIGGPPGQTFSAAGRRASGVEGTNEARGLLFQDYARLLDDLKPRGFLFENVYGMTGAENGQSMAQVVEAFEEIGSALPPIGASRTGMEEEHLAPPLAPGRRVRLKNAERIRSGNRAVVENISGNFAAVSATVSFPVIGCCRHRIP